MYGYLRRLQLRRMCAADGMARGRINLQMFAGEGGEGGNGNTGNESGDTGNTGNDGEGGKDEGGKGEKMLTQAEVNRIVQRTIAEERARAKRETEAARTEAEKLATMTAEQRAKHDAEKREAELTKREAELNRRELRATAAETLAGKNLPSSLLDLIDYSNAENCTKSIEKVEEAWRSAVQTGVEDRLKGKPPKAGGGSANKDGVWAAFEKLNPNLKL